jgi:hypothetical protein
MRSKCLFFFFLFYTCAGICDDVASFVRSSTLIVMGILQKLMNCVAFAGVLYTTSPRLVLFLLVYTSVGTYVTTYLFGKNLMKVFYKVRDTASCFYFSFFIVSVLSTTLPGQQPLSSPPYPLPKVSFFSCLTVTLSSFIFVSSSQALQREGKLRFCLVCRGVLCLLHTVVSVLTASFFPFFSPLP